MEMEETPIPPWRLYRMQPPLPQRRPAAEPTAGPSLPQRLPEAAAAATPPAETVVDDDNCGPWTPQGQKRVKARGEEIKAEEPTDCLPKKQNTKPSDQESDNSGKGSKNAQSKNKPMPGTCGPAFRVILFLPCHETPALVQVLPQNLLTAQASVQDFEMFIAERWKQLLPENFRMELLVKLRRDVEPARLWYRDLLLHVVVDGDEIYIRERQRRVDRR